MGWLLTGLLLWLGWEIVAICLTAAYLGDTGFTPIAQFRSMDDERI